MKHKNIFFKSLIFVLLFSPIFYLFASENEYPVITKGETISSASELNYPPFSVVDEQGRADGFSVELLRETLNAVGLNVDFKIGEWSEVKKDLEVGNIRVLPLVGRTPEREEIFDFTVPYFSIKGAIYVRSDYDNIKKLEDLKDKELVELDGDNAFEFIKRNNLSDKIITTKTFEEAFQKLSGGEHDAIIVSTLVGDQVLNSLKIKNIIRLNIPIDGFTQNFCFAVRENDKELLERLNEGLSIIFANGTHNRLMTKWFPSDFETNYSLSEILDFILPYLLIVFISGIFLFIFILKNQVKSKTKSLSKEIEKTNLLQREMQKFNEELKIKNNEVAQKNIELLDLVEKLEETQKSLIFLNESVNKKIEELEKMNKLMIGRELKMIELKKEIADLKAKSTKE